MSYKKSFTLSEIMIAMAIFGIIVAACVPIVMNMSPNKNAIMIKKAYYTTEQIVSDLINDPIYYPNGDFAVDSNVMAEETATNASPEKPTQFAKFSCLFAKKMNIALDSHTDTLENFCKRVSDNGKYDVDDPANHILVTNDGMIWNFILCNGNNSYEVDNDGVPVAESVCRVDVSIATDDIAKTGYDTDGCIDQGNGWGTNICGQSKINKIGKAAFVISHDGGISLSAVGALGNQPNIQNIINGKTSLLGK